MTDDARTYAHCEACGKPIRDGQAYMLTTDDCYLHQNGRCAPLPGEAWDDGEDRR